MECACVKNDTKIKKVIFVRLLSEVVGFLPSNSKMPCSEFYSPHLIFLQYQTDGKRVKIKISFFCWFTKRLSYGNENAT